jgi:hypothetical protein
MPLASLRSGRAHRSNGAWRACWTGRSNRSGKAAVLYHHVSRIRPGRDLHDTSGGKFWSNPPETARRCAHYLHRFGWANFDLHVGVARSPDPPCDNQFASRYGGGGDQYFRMGISAQRDQTSSCSCCDSADKPYAHSKSPLRCVIRNLIPKAQCQRCKQMERFAARMLRYKNL